MYLLKSQIYILNTIHKCIGNNYYILIYFIEITLFVTKFIDTIIFVIPSILQYIHY